jgi:subtilisin family serine protease
VRTKRCTVINQSFCWSNEQSSPSLSVYDLAKDYLAIKPPYPTIVQAAGNVSSPPLPTEYVNCKGFNCISVGNHIDGAGSMNGSSIFINPSSTHNDRELPDLCANGTSVSATGLSMSGTSFSSPAVAGSAAVIQSVDSTLKAWPEGCRAILLASAGRNVSGGTWNQAARSGTVDGVDGSGALDTNEAAQIARVRKRRNSSAARRGWDVGTLRSSDIRGNRTSNFRYQVAVPASGPRKMKVALAWDSKVTYTSDPSATFGVRVTDSKLAVDMDLYIYLNGRLVQHSSTFDNSFEIVEFDAQRGATYEIRIKRFSGTDNTWFGVAWTVV